MATKAAMVTKADVKRAVQGTLEAGVEVGRVVVENGKVIVFAKTDGEPRQSGNSLDRYL